MLSHAARAFLIWQVFDEVHRSPHPVRFARLQESVEDLTAWPDFRDAALRDPRFLVIGDAIDIATAGIHASAPVEEIVLQTLDLAHVPMTDQTLTRLVRRLRPDLPAGLNPIGLAMARGGIFRPCAGHLARYSWIEKACPLPLPLWLPLTVEEAARELVAQAERPLRAADLAAALGDRFEMTPIEVYCMLAEESMFLLLPDGTVCLYDSVADEVESQKGSEPQLLVTGEEQADSVSTEGLQEACELPPNLVHQVVFRVRHNHSPVSTGDILESVIGLKPDDPRYVATFRAVTARLGVAPELMPVGGNRWYSTSLIPAEVFRRVDRPTAFIEPAKSGQQDLLPAPAIQGTATRLVTDSATDFVTVTVTRLHLERGCLSDPRLAALLPDQPMLQLLVWTGEESPVWYNVEHSAIFGLAAWHARKEIQPNDTVTLTFRNGRLSPTVRQGTRPPTPLGRTPLRPMKQKQPTRSLLAAVTEMLDQAGGSLDQAQLMILLGEEDPWVTWAEVEPLFHRLPILKLDRGRCYLVRQLSGRGKRSQWDSAVRAETLGLLNGLPDDVRSDPRVQDLVNLVARQPRVTVHDESLLMPAAQREQGHEWELLVLSHLRYALSNLLGRSDLSVLLPHLEDYFQEAAIGVMKAVERFDRTRAQRLQHAMGWSIRAQVNRAMPWYVSPIRVPVHAFEVVWGKEDPDGSPDDEDPTEQVGGDSVAMAEFWARVEWDDWDTFLQAHQEGAEPLAWLGMRETEVEMVDHVSHRELMSRIHHLLQTRFTEREATVLKRRFGLFGEYEETLEEIGQSMGVTRERIRQIEKKVLNRLRNLASRRKWRQFLQEE